MYEVVVQRLTSATLVLDGVGGVVGGVNSTFQLLYPKGKYEQYLFGGEG
jgi:hypothetical protein